MELKLPELKTDPHRLEVYSELRKSKTFVGTLTFQTKSNRFRFEYDLRYLRSRSAIPLGTEFPLSKQVHISKKYELFPTLIDRIPSKENPAYPEYCESQGISPSETNPITLLTTIGRRGPSTFIFESVLIELTDMSTELRQFRKTSGLTLREVSAAFDLHLPTLSRTETGQSKDKNTLRLLKIYLNFPEVALWQIQLNQRKLHRNALKKCLAYFHPKANET
jgi:HipA-like protein